MAVAFWCVLIAALLPIVTVGLAKSGGGYDNSSPRAYLERVQGWRQRADWAHRNHIEAFAPFAAAVLTAEFLHARPGTVNALAVAFVALRLAYTGAYIANIALLRTLLWAGGVACVIALFVVAA